MRVVLDTVVFVRALLNPKGIWGRLLFDLSDRYTIVLSPEIIGEIMNVLYRPALRERFPQLAGVPQIERLIVLFEQADVVEPPQVVEVCRDPADDKFFACAVQGDASYIVSEDNDVLAVGENHGVKTIRAAELVAILDAKR